MPWAGVLLTPAACLSHLHLRYSDLLLVLGVCAQEFDVNPTRTVREEFYSVYQQQLAIVSEQERISKELENVGEDMNKMQVSSGDIAAVPCCCCAVHNAHANACLRQILSN